jgi:hypothetical protein
VPDEFELPFPRVEVAQVEKSSSVRDAQEEGAFTASTAIDDALAVVVSRLERGKGRAGHSIHRRARPDLVAVLVASGDRKSPNRLGRGKNKTSIKLMR